MKPKKIIGNRQKAFELIASEQAVSEQITSESVVNTDSIKTKFYPLPDLKSYKDNEKMVIVLSGDVIEFLIPEFLKDSGIVCLPISQADKTDKYKQLIFQSQILQNFQFNKSTNLNQPNNGFFLLIPKQIKSGVVKVKIIALSNNKTFDNNIIIVEENAQLEILHEAYSLGKETYRNSAFQIFAKDNSNIKLAHIIKPEGKFELNEKIILNKNAVMKRNIDQFEKSKINSEIILKGEHSQIEDKELIFAEKQNILNINTVILHKADKSISHAIFKGIAKDASTCNVNALVHIDKTKGVNSYLGEHILLLDKDATANAIPGMEIDAFDVRASHAASITRLDENQLFYAQSRGIEIESAKSMLI